MPLATAGQPVQRESAPPIGKFKSLHYMMMMMMMMIYDDDDDDDGDGDDGDDVGDGDDGGVGDNCVKR